MTCASLPLKCLQQYVQLAIVEGGGAPITCPDMACRRSGVLQDSEVCPLQDDMWVRRGERKAGWDKRASKETGRKSETRWGGGDYFENALGVALIGHLRELLRMMRWFRLKLKRLFVNW